MEGAGGNQLAPWDVTRPHLGHRVFMIPSWRWLRSAQVARQPGPGVRDRRVHGGVQDVRRAHLRVRQGDRLIYAARTRNGFTPIVRAQLMKKFSALETKECPFANLPEKKSGRWGAGLTKAKMKDCRWLKPVLVGQFEFLEWTGDSHLRHSKFIALREDKSARDVKRE